MLVIYELDGRTLHLRSGTLPDCSDKIDIGDTSPVAQCARAGEAITGKLGRLYVECAPAYDRDTGELSGVRVRAE